MILRSDNGETWKEHTLEATEDAVQEVLQESFDADGKEFHSFGRMVSLIILNVSLQLWRQANNKKVLQDAL